MKLRMLMYISLFLNAAICCIDFTDAMVDGMGSSLRGVMTLYIIRSSKPRCSSEWKIMIAIIVA